MQCWFIGLLDPSDTYKNVQCILGLDTDNC